MITLRSAEPADQVAIHRLVRAAGINPMGLDWRRFIVAVAPDGQIIGTGQLKPHGAVTELASIAVIPAYQGQGYARLIIERLLSQVPPELWLMCESRLTPLYARFGFQEVLTPAAMPPYFRRMRRLVDVFSRLGRSDNRLAVMVRRG